MIGNKAAEGLRQVKLEQKALLNIKKVCFMTEMNSINYTHRQKPPVHIIDLLRSSFWKGF
jgi:hypothetical protein